ncbi:beta-1,3-glucosyltransferase [Agrilus planipennis]|uniref:Beta-1,3-glucosyltransferase n=1 Tax=Agrilus planipennis TaxID=224129 RepID=A0A1W4XHZ2_AGRPL|nr:beta-1,3-glucosyltransferase [Agrilus planipennis]
MLYFLFLYNLTLKYVNQLKDSATVYYSNEFPHVGSWTVFPLITTLLNTQENDTSWYIFLHDNTWIDIKSLQTVLNKYDSKKKIWLGHAVFDREPSITHHFDFVDDPSKKFKYPISASGFIISSSLLKSIGERILNEKTEIDFSIDFIYELSKLIWDNGNGVKVTHEPSFCPSVTSNCTTYPVIYYPCKDIVSKNSIYFAVKTFHGYHDTRLPIVKDTWAKHTPHVGFFSDIEDKNYGTISVNVPNSDKGHCIKTIKIIENVAEIMKSNKNYKWLFIVDDDTILSVTRVRQFLSCYDENENVAIGERYGYNVVSGWGYNYLTGGAGILISRPLVEKLSTEGCHCPSVSSPDDMVLGLCFKKLDVDVIHSPYFHQARPNDYTPEYLEGQKPITFHKYWMLDPFNVYQKWFLSKDVEEVKDEL